MPTPDPRGGFANVDQAADPSGFVRVLDTLTALDVVQAYKRRTYAAMGIHPGATLLDVGCGTGDDARELARFVAPGGRVVGVDRSETVIDAARERGDGSGLPVEFRVADAYRLPFPDEAFDACRADRVFHHLEHPRQALDELVRVTRRAGRVVLIDPDFETAVVDAPDRAFTRRLLNFYGDGYQNGWMGRRLPGLVRDASLIEVIVEPVTVLLPDLRQANAVLALEDTVARAATAGVVSESDGTAWLDGLRAASEAGRFFASLTGFIVAGRKP